MAYTRMSCGAVGTTDLADSWADWLGHTRVGTLLRQLEPHSPLIYVEEGLVNPHYVAHSRGQNLLGTLVWAHSCGHTRLGTILCQVICVSHSRKHI